MRHLLHLLQVLTICDALNEVDGVGDLFICLAIVVQHQKRCSAPLRLNNVPRFLDGIQLATLRGQEHLLKLIIEYVTHHFSLVNLKVVHYHQAWMALTFLLELDDEWKERVSVVCLCESVSMKETSICTNGSNHGNGNTPCIRQFDPHPFFQPHS